MKPLRILVTGSRDWEDWKAIGTHVVRWLTQQRPGVPVAKLWQDVTIVHGDCPTGADAIAKRFALVMGMTQEPHRADWDRYGRAAGPIRNAKMAAAGADVCLAFPIGRSKGTRNCIELAEAAGIPTITIEGSDD